MGCTSSSGKSASHRRRTSHALVGSSLFGLSLLLLGPTARAASPRLQIDPSEVDLGEISKGATSEAVFVLRNTGDATLEILSADPACGCTVATFDRTIAAGGTGQVTAKLATAGLDGVIAKSIVLRTNDPARPTTLLVLRATILSSVRVLPDDRLIVRNYKNDSTGRLVLRRDESATGRFVPTSLRASASWLEPSVRQLTDFLPSSDEVLPGRPGDWLLEVRLRGAPYGQHHATVAFETGLARQPRIEIPVFADVHPPVALPADKLVLAAPFEETVVISVRKGLDPAALRADARPGQLSVELEPGGGRFYKAHVRWRGGPAAQEAAVSFQVGDERIELPVEIAAAAP